MILRLLLIILFSLPAIGFGKDSEKVWIKKQTKLNFECEKARLIKLAPIKRKIFKECREDKKAEHKDCFKLADKYNAERKGGLRPRFYDLPQCQVADSYWKKYLMGN